MSSPIFQIRSDFIKKEPPRRRNPAAVGAKVLITVTAREEMIIFIKNIVDLLGSEIKLNLIEVLDMEDNILNISLNIWVDDGTIDLINQILIKNGFTHRL